MDTLSVTISCDVHDTLKKTLFNEIKITFNYKKSDESVSFKINETEYNYMFQNFVLNKESGRIFIVKASNTLSSFDFLVSCDQNEFKKISTWFGSINETGEIKKESSANFKELKTAFQNDFIETDKYIFTKASNHIIGCNKEWLKRSIYAPIVVICQSSGYGKTRFLYEFAKEHLTVFICLRGSHESGYPPRSKTANEFMTSLRGNKIEYFLIAFIQTSLKVYDALTKDKPDLNKKEIANEFRKCQPWLSRTVDDIKNNMSFCDKVVQRAEMNRKSLTDTKKIEDEINDLKKKIKETQIEFLTLAIDEAHMITKESADDKSLFRVLRTAIINLFNGFPIVFVMTSTNTSISDFNLNKSQITASQREKGLKNYPPFCELVFCDQLKSNKYEQNIKSAVENTSLLEFIKTRDSLNTIYYYGRPFWCSLNEACKKFSNANHSYLLDLAKIKLIHAHDWQDPDLNKTYASFAILASRTNILDNIVIKNQDLTSNLISRYMATLFNIDENCNILSFRYVSEPILAEAASHFMSDDSILEEILSYFHTIVYKSDVVSTGSIGELIAEIIMLKAHDFGSATDFTKPLNVSKFMIGLIGEDSFNENFKAHLETRLANGVVAFNHFNQKLDALKYNDLIYDYIGRCAAGRFKTNFPVYDFFIPVIFEDNRVGAILVQVKNNAEITENKIETIVAGLNPSKAFEEKKEKKSNLATDLLTYITEENFISILICLGNDLNITKYIDQTFVISGIDSFNLNNRIKSNMKLILNHSRNKMKEYKDKNVCRLVTKGCAREDYF